MNRIEIFEPEIGSRTATFRWRVDPPSPLYRRTSFELRFPESIDLARVPKALWWRLAFLCLHAHWTLLRPCRVKIPVRLAAAEKELWARLVDSAVATLEAYRGTHDTARAVEITDGDTPLPPWEPLPPGARCAAAFSGGKDSLLHAGLLRELTENPILVTTTSPMPPLHDHETPRRRAVLAEMARRKITLVEVGSDFRDSWDNAFPDRIGYPVSVNELTDTHLYLAALLAAGTARGATHFFLASENEVQENIEVDGRVIQHTHFMYSAVHQRSLQALLAPAGLAYSSLTTPLHSAQVQRLLAKRYPDLCDLQYSCWRLGPSEAACSRCSQCFRVALGAIAAGRSPARMGIDLPALLLAQKDWMPPAESDERPQLPRSLVGRRLNAQTLRSIRSVPAWRMAAALARPRFSELFSDRSRSALAAWNALRRRTRRLRVEKAPGCRSAFRRYLDPLLADRVMAIYTRSFPREDESSYKDALARSDSLTRWIVEPIEGAAHA